MSDSEDPLAKCEHPTSELREKRSSNGIRIVAPQCLTCGNYAGKRVRNVDAPAECPPFDDSLAKQWYLRYATASVDRVAQWRRRYEDHLRSDKWRRLRELVIEREDHLCQGCRDARGTQVHHLTYRRMGDELLTDLALYCDSCHERAHEEPNVLVLA